MMVSERSHHKDVQSEKIFEICLPLKRYSVLKVQLSAILLLKIAQNGEKFNWKARFI